MNILRRITCFATAMTLSAALLCPQTLALDEQIDRSFLSEYTQTYFDDSISDLISSEVTCIYQSFDGYIWLGTYNGLVRYDGSDFRIYNSSTDDEFKGNSIRDICEDKSSRLWLGTNDAGALCMDTDGSITNISKENEKYAAMRSDSVRFITTDDKGNSYFFTTDGVFAVNNDMEPITLPDELSGFAASAAECDGNKIYCINSLNGQFYVYNANDGKMSNYSEDTDFSSVVCKALDVLSDGRVAIGTDTNTAYILSVGETKYKTIVKQYSTGNRSVATCVYADNNDNIFIYTGTGLCYFDEKMTLHNVDGFPNDFRLQDIIQDYEGNYWFATTNSGALRLTENLFVDYNYKENLTIEAEVNATVMYNGTRYIGTDKGLIAVNHRDDKLEQLLSSTRIRGLLVDSKNRLWSAGFVLNYEEGSPIAPLVCYDGENITTFSTADGLISNEIRCVYELQDGTIAVGTNENGVQFIQDGKVLTDDRVVAYNSNYAAIPHTKILNMIQRKNGDLYVGLDGNGLFIANADSAKTLHKADGLSGEVILRTANDIKTDGVWISTGSGVDFIDENGTLKNIDKLNDTNMTSVFDIVFIDDDKMFLLTENCIYTCSRENLLSDSPLAYSTLSKKNGLPSTINANAWNNLLNGELFICCFKGIASIDVNDIHSEQSTPNLIINNIDVDSQTSEKVSGSITLSQNATRITIDLALLSFVQDPDYAIEYSLSGQDEQLIHLTAAQLRDTKISYTNLRGGDHTFTARIVNPDGTYGNSVKLIITKERTFFEQPLIWIISITIISAVIILITVEAMRIRQKSLIKKQEEYKKITIEAITAIANTIDAKDEYTRGHSVRVASFSVEIAKRMKLSNQTVENIFYMALLHDIGKIANPNEILNKPSRLTEEEYNIMKQHPRIGYEILKSITTVKNIGWGARYHHERYDGKGYNTGISGTDIPIEARIICAADSYDAMSSRRAYRDGLPKTYIISEFRKCRGTQFDPDVTDIVLSMLEQSYFDSFDAEASDSEHADVHIVSDSDSTTTDQTV